jgi:hypothetical protein
MLGLMMLLIAFASPFAGYSDSYASDHVILLHGLARTKRSMNKIETRLEAEGFRVSNVGYPSREKTVKELAENFIPSAVEQCRRMGASRIHFVSHSLGGILVRYYLKYNSIPELGRVVMLSPPNGGSEIVDTFKNNFFFKWLNGPAGQELGTDANGVPQTLGPVDFDVGIITGDRSVNCFLSHIIPGDDDGKVSVENAQVAGMRDFIVIHASHPFIMRNNRVIDQVVTFLRFGHFEKKKPDQTAGDEDRR